MVHTARPVVLAMRLLAELGVPPYGPLRRPVVPSVRPIWPRVGRVVTGDRLHCWIMTEQPSRAARVHPGYPTDRWWCPWRILGIRHWLSPASAVAPGAKWPCLRATIAGMTVALDRPEWPTAPAGADHGGPHGNLPLRRSPRRDVPAAFRVACGGWRLRRPTACPPRGAPAPSSSAGLVGFLLARGRSEAPRLGPRAAGPGVE